MDFCGEDFNDCRGGCFKDAADAFSGNDEDDFDNDGEGCFEDFDTDDEGDFCNDLNWIDNEGEDIDDDEKGDDDGYDNEEDDDECMDNFLVLFLLFKVSLTFLFFVTYNFLSPFSSELSGYKNRINSIQILFVLYTITFIYKKMFS